MYIDKDELRAAIGFQATAMEATLNDGDFDTQMETVITDVSALIDGYIGKKYDVATVTTNAILKRICTKISMFDVYTKFTRADVPETIRLEKEDAQKMLRDIQQGKLELAADDAAFVEDALESEFTSKDQVFTVGM